MIIGPATTLRSLPQRSVRAADVDEATSSRAPIPNVTAASPAVPNPKTSSSHAPNVTKSDWAAAIRPNRATTAAHPLGRSRAATVRRGRGGRGGDLVTVEAGEDHAGGGDDGDGADDVRPAPRRRRGDEPERVTPTSRPRAHDVSMMPTDPAAPLVGHVVGRPRDQPDVEHDLRQGEQQQAERRT